VSKLSDQVSVRISPEWRETLRSIEQKHRIPPPEFIRGLVEAGLQFYQDNGWFAFPVSVQPVRDYVQAVAETQGRYDASPAPSTAPAAAATKSRKTAK
jgi:hypothetical protein